MSNSIEKIGKKTIKSNRSTRDELEKLSKETLIDQILRLEANNFQLRNILRKYLAKNKDQSQEQEEEDNEKKDLREQYSVLMEENHRFQNDGKPPEEEETSPSGNESSKDVKEGGTTVKRERRTFNFDRFAKRHVLMRFLYFGWDYQGFVCQDDTTATIEHHIFEALTRTCLIQSRQTSNYYRCGRTDKEVSAFYQVISIDLRSKFPLDSETSEMNNRLDEELDYCGILNRVLPKNIQCIAWMPIHCPLYNARFDCKRRTYRYYFPRGNLNIKKMRIACQYLECEGDFRNLCKMDVQNGVINYRRQIEKATILVATNETAPIPFIVQEDEEKEKEMETNGYEMFYLEIKANAFLWHQIRCVMAILLLIGTEKEEPEVIQELLDVVQNPCKPQYSHAIALPLNLYDCEMREKSQHFRAEEYNLSLQREEEGKDKEKEQTEQILKCSCAEKESVLSNWHLTKSNLCNLIGNLQTEWTRLNIQVTMIRSVLRDLEQLLEQHFPQTKVRNQSWCLETGAKPSQYRKLMNRSRCESLENRIQHFAKKQRSNISKENMDMEISMME